MQYALVNTVLLLTVSIFYAFCCTLNEFFAWMLIWVRIGSCALYVPDLFQQWLEHLFDDRHILYPWSVNMFLTCDWIYLNTINTITITQRVLIPYCFAGTTFFLPSIPRELTHYSVCFCKAIPVHWQQNGRIFFVSMYNCYQQFCFGQCKIR
jgi:hypothetical protein